jgi:hypothetical protein
MSRDVSNSEDIIDSRDVIERIEELQGELEAAHRSDFEDPLTAPALEDWIKAIAAPDGSPEFPYHMYTEEAAELLQLRELADSGIYDWENGVSLIRETYFEDYAQEFAEEIGAISRETSWPACHIDWSSAADSLKMDFTAIDYDGVTYYAR